MSWKNEAIIILRNLINDVGETPSYNDERLGSLLTTSAQYVQFDVDLDNKYVINAQTSDITPDPLSNNDSLFISLACLKAACFLDQSTVRTRAAMDGVRASLGSASLTVNSKADSYKLLLSYGPCALYKELTHDWNIKNADAIHAIFSPFVGNQFDPKNMNSYSLPRNRYDTFYR